MKQKSRRMIRVGEEIRHVLSEIIRRDLSEPALELASITEVDVTNDLSLARVYVSSLGDDESRENAAERLNEIQGKVRHLLSQKTRLRHTPQLQFHPDDTAARADHIGRILNEVLPEDEEKSEED
ncbi:MAG: 30S ribosome-binding factor RbfA [Thermoanaerobaculia bacterium]|nr:30S ribosome-binding factor RbfA [Thermoanaerobaculia bacterium]